LLSLALGISEVEKTFRNDFMKKYNKIYKSSEEYTYRLSVFKENLGKAAELNVINPSARFGVTKFSDLTTEEFQQFYLMKNFVRSTPEMKNERKMDINYGFELPTDFDWSSKGAVTPVKNQGQCGSCWAFSATEAIESQWNLSGNPLPVLGPQQIVDCDIGNGDEGCDGGDTPTAYEYVIKAGGMETESDYPYTAEDGTCAFKSKEVVARIVNYTYVTVDKNETQMQYGLYAVGPLSVCVDAASWQFYVFGVIGDVCGDDLDHCVMVTGFSDYEDDVWGTYQVWNVRNSWGADWGMEGYLYVERGGDYCGIADEVTIPLVK